MGRPLRPIARAGAASPDVAILLRSPLSQPLRWRLPGARWVSSDAPHREVRTLPVEALLALIVVAVAANLGLMAALVVPFLVDASGWGDTSASAAPRNTEGAVILGVDDIIPLDDDPMPATTASSASRPGFSSWRRP